MGTGRAPWWPRPCPFGPAKRDSTLRRMSGAPAAVLSGGVERAAMRTLHHLGGAEYPAGTCGEFLKSLRN